MRKRWGLIAVSIAVLMVAMGGQLAAQQAAGQWVAFSQPSFNILFPAQPKLEDSKKERSLTRQWTYGVPGEQFFGVGYTDYDFKFDAGEALVADRDGFVKAVGGTLTSSKRIEFARSGGDPLPAMQFTVSDEGFKFNGMGVIDGQRPYVVIVGGNADISAAPEKFFSSFKLTR